MKQEWFARKMGISQQNDSGMELQEIISDSQLEKTSKTMGVTLEPSRSWMKIPFYCWPQEQIRSCLLAQVRK